MSGYRLWIPTTGDYLNSEGDVSFVAPTVKEAWQIIHEQWEEHGCWIDWAEQDDRWIHSTIASGHVLYKRDIDSEDPFIPEGMEAGDTIFSWLDDEDRELCPNEVRVWSCGAALPHWRIAPPWWTGCELWDVLVGDGPAVLCADKDEAERVRVNLVEVWVESWKVAHPECRDAASMDWYWDA